MASATPSWPGRRAVRSGRPARLGPLAIRLVFVLAAYAVSSAPAAFPAHAAGEDFAAIFGDDYARAENFIRDNPWITGALRLPAEEARLAVAVVFPEILRYSHLLDRIQVRALKVLYVQYGPKYANFSIGRFQMKLSFIEQLEAEWNRRTNAEEKAAVGIPAFAGGDTPAARRDRVLRLDDLRRQVDYLRVFLVVMKKMYGSIAFGGAEDRLRFYATAYNFGFTAGERRIRQAQAEKHFHLGLFAPDKKYGYADVSVDYFRRAE